MKLCIPRLVLLAALGVAPGAISYGLMDSRQAGGVAPEFFLMQLRDMQSMPMSDAAAKVQDGRNQEVLAALSLPPVGWRHYDRPPALSVTVAAAPASTLEPNSNLWLLLFGALLLGGGITFALFRQRQAPAPSRRPTIRPSSQESMST